MPFYEYVCEACESHFDKKQSVADRDVPVECPDCGEETSKRAVTGSRFNFVGDDWASKNNRVKGQMAAKNRKLKAKERELINDGGVPGGKLVPNVGGERADSWSEASKLAKSKGKDSSGYDKMASKDKGSR